jgi:glutamine amidotransferase
MAIYKPAGKNIKKRWLRNSFDSNPHGAGIAWATGKALHTDKGMWTWEEFFSRFQQHQKHAMLIHFRWATHGERDDTNCHPWTVCEGKYAMIHNGVIDIKRHDDKLSDTGHFARLVLEPMLYSVEPQNPALRYLMEEAVGSFNKLAVMDSSGKAVIYNESKGVWRNGTWFSNTGFERELFHQTSYLDYTGKHMSHQPYTSNSIPFTGKTTETGKLEAWLKERDTTNKSDTAVVKSDRWRVFDHDECEAEFQAINSDEKAPVVDEIDEQQEEDILTAMSELNMSRKDAEDFVVRGIV